MMKHHRSLWALTALCLTAALLAGCAGGGPTAGTASPAPSAFATGSAAPQVTSQAIATPEPTATPEPAVVLSAGVRAENNGGYFLGLGRYVYFREYPYEAFSTALWGEFLSACAPDVEAILRIYDAQTGEVVDSLPDDGQGPLWYAGGRLWLTMTDGESFHVYTLAPDGSGRAEMAFGRVMGVSDSQELVCTQGSEPGGAWSSLTLWRGGKAVRTLAPEEDQSFEYLGFLGESVLYLEWNNDAPPSLYQLLETGDPLLLGQLPRPQEMTYGPELDQLLVEGERAYLVFGYYEGTGHFLYDYQCFQALSGSPDSLLELEAPHSERADGAGAIPSFQIVDGQLAILAEKPRSIELSWGNFGDLTYWDEEQVSIRLLPNFIPYDPYGSTVKGGLILQTAQQVGEDLYLMVADAEYAPEADVGWRLAYRLVDLYYLRVPIRGNSQVITLTGPDWQSYLSQDALLSVKVDATEAEVEAARPVTRVKIDNTDGFHEPGERKWFLITALENGIQVRVEEADMTNSLAARLGWVGEFLTGAVRWNGTLNKGQTIAVLAGTPWNYEARVTARQEDRFASYVFGEDNWAYSTLEAQDQPLRYAAGVEQPSPDYFYAAELMAFLDGAWIYRDPDSGTPLAILEFDKTDGSLRVSDTEEEIHLAFDHLYTGEEDLPDLLCFKSSDETSWGDYLVDCVTTDAEQLVWLRQANNGDGILSRLIPNSQNAYSFLLHRYRGGVCAETAYENAWFPGLVWKYDREGGRLWVTGTFEYEWDEAMESSVWCHAYNHRIVSYPIRDAGSIPQLQTMGQYPMTVFWITTEKGQITKLESPEEVNTTAGHG